MTIIYIFYLGKKMDISISPIPGTQVLRRSNQILRLIALHQKRGVQIKDVAGPLGLKPPTAHRLLQGLVQERMAQYDERSHRYFLGPELYELGLTAASRFDLLNYIQPSIDRLSTATEDTLVVTLRSGLDGICIEHRTGAFPIRTSVVNVGTRRPLAAGAGGLAILSQMEPEQAARIIDENSIRIGQDPEKLTNRVHDARHAGYSVNFYQRIMPTITAIGIPIIGAYSQCVAGVGIIALSSRLYGKRREEVIKMLMAESLVMTKALTAAQRI